MIRSLPCALATLCLAAAPGLAQGTADLTYVVEEGGREVGREHVVIRAGQGPGGSGLQIDARNRATREDLRATLTRSENVVEGLVLEIRGPTGTLVVRAANRGRRVFISTTGEGARGGRELPGGPNVVFLDDALVSLTFAAADLATPEGARLVGIRARTGDRVDFVATRSGGEGRATIELSGGVTGRIVVDPDGRVSEAVIGGKRLVRSRT